MIEFGEWLPDQPDFENPGCITVLNAFPVATSYKQLSDFSVYSGALTERPLGSYPAKDTGGNTAMFAGSASKLYKLATDTTWSDVSIVTGYTAANWEFTQFGNDVYAVDINENIQYYTMGTSTLFADLVAIKAVTIASSEKFVMVGNTYDATDGNVPHRVRWCAIGDPTDWTVAAATQADYQDLNSNHGEVKKVVKAGDFYAFQEKAITRLAYVGSPEVFSVDTFETSRGAKYTGSVASIGDMVFYLAEDGFYMMRHSQSVPIGADKVNKTFFTDLHGTFGSRIKASIDPINNLVIWAYPSVASNGELDKQIIFNWKNNRWSQANYSLSHIGQSVSLGYTLEDLDTVSASIDAMTESLDSRVWQGGEVSLMGFNSAWKMGYFTGDAKAVTIETKEVGGVNKARMRIVRPLTDATVTVQIGTRDSQSGTRSWSSAYSLESSGVAKVRENARYFVTRLTTSGSYSHIQGVDAEFSPGGRR